MNKQLLILLCVALPFFLFGQDVLRRDEQKQPEPFVKFITVSVGPYSQVRQPALINATVPTFDSIFSYLDNTRYLRGKHTDIQPYSPIILGAQFRPADYDFFFSGYIPFYNHQYPAYLARPDSVVSFYALGLHPGNFRDFNFHVVLNDSMEVVPWQQVPEPVKEPGVARPFVMFGPYLYAGQQLLLEIVHKNDYSIRDGIIIDWKEKLLPVVQQLFLVKTDGDFFNIRHKEKGTAYATRFDEHNLPENLKMPVDSISEIAIEFKKHTAWPFYIAVVHEKDTTVLDGGFAENKFYLDSRYFSIPGMYELVICRRGYEALPEKYDQQILRLSFEVYKPAVDNAGILFRKALPYLAGVVLLAVIGFVWYYRNNRRRLKEARYQQQLKQVQLQSVRGQLNPHFVFNALNSIQYLVQQQDVAAAGIYLNRFAAVTRAVLESSEASLISMEEELSLLDNYLQMEQLRYPFTFTVHIDPAIDRINTEIPAMLLQPFVENAVRHGIAALRDEGKLEIGFYRNNKKLEIQIRDNGKGFSTTEEPDSSHRGLRLSKERIRLLNETYNEELIDLRIQSSDEGTVILVTLNEWLSDD